MFPCQIAALTEPTTELGGQPVSQPLMKEHRTESRGLSGGPDSVTRSSNAIHLSALVSSEKHGMMEGEGFPSVVSGLPPQS